MLGQSVSAQAFIALAKEKGRLRLAPRPTHAAGTGHSDIGDIDQAGFDQRNERQQDRSGIAAGRTDKLGRAYGLAVQLGQTVNGLGEQLWRGMLLAIKFPVNPGVAQTEIRTQVDNPLACLPKRHGILRRQTMREGEKEKLRPAAKKRVDCGFREEQFRKIPNSGKAGQHAAGRLARMLARGHGSDGHRRMPRKNRAKLLTRISIGTDDRDWDFSTHGDQAAAIEVARAKRASVRSLPMTTNIS